MNNFNEYNKINTFDNFNHLIVPLITIIESDGRMYFSDYQIPAMKISYLKAIKTLLLKEGKKKVKGRECVKVRSLTL